jgi:type IV secretion system protein VirB10
MRFGRQERVIDASAELDRVERQRIEGAYGPSELGATRRPSPPGARTFMLVILACAGALMLTLTYKAFSVRSAAAHNDASPQEERVQQVIPALTLQPVSPEPTPQQAVVPAPAVPALDPEPEPVRLQAVAPEKTQDEQVRERMLQSALTADEQTESNPSPAGPDSVQDGSLTGGQGKLAERLQPLRLAAASATRMANRDLLITQGTVIDCVLETRIITTQPSMTTCHLTRDIYSTSGRVVLLDRGAKVVGFYQSGMQQGQARVFVQWSRVETPQGVLITLDSPGTGPLGESGLGGKIETHCWTRFGGAILISLIGDLGSWASRT